MQLLTVLDAFFMGFLWESLALFSIEEEKLFFHTLFVNTDMEDKTLRTPEAIKEMTKLKKE